MSMTTCHDCGAYIDTDCDPGCYIEVAVNRPGWEIPICESCRDEREADDAATELFSALWEQRI